MTMQEIQRSWCEAGWNSDPCCAVAQHGLFASAGDPPWTQADDPGPAAAAPIPPRPDPERTWGFLPTRFHNPGHRSTSENSFCRGGAYSRVISAGASRLGGFGFSALTFPGRGRRHGSCIHSSRIPRGLGSSRCALRGSRPCGAVSIGFNGPVRAPSPAPCGPCRRPDFAASAHRDPRRRFECPGRAELRPNRGPLQVLKWGGHARKAGVPAR